MTDEPKELTPHLLRKIREDIGDIRDKIVDIAKRLDGLVKQVIILEQETSMLTSEIAPGEMGAVNQDIAELKRRVEALEKQRH